MTIKNSIIQIFVFLIFFNLQLTAVQKPIEEELSHHFFDVEGCFLLFDLSENRYVYEHNAELANSRYSPCSTFKIPNSLIALEERAVENESSILPWDKTAQFLSSWEKDHNLRTAIENSVVWFYQEIAKKIGTEKYESYLSLMDYGNKDPKSELTRFWLQGSLEISPKEQIQFLNKVYRNQLPFSEETMQTVRDILVLEKGEYSCLSGKTGTAKDNEFGWFIGHLSSQGKEYTFVSFIKGRGLASGLKAKEITKKMLSSFYSESTTNTL
jgi:beta-lactamase class D